MALAADIGSKLDAGSLLTAFTGSLQGPGGQLNAVQVPGDPNAASQAAGGASGLSVSGIADAVTQLAQQAQPLIASLPGPGQSIARITNTLTTVEQLTTGNLIADLTTLAQNVITELEGPQDDSVLATVMKIVNTLSSAPEGQALLALINALSGGTGLSLPSGMGDTLPAIEGAVRAVGGLMILQSVISEADRLTSTAAGFLDAARAQAEIVGFQSALPDTLAAQITATDATDPVAVAAALAAVGTAADSFDALNDYLSRAMGFGEATLAYLDVTTVQTEMAAATAMLTGVDLAPLERVIQSAANGLAPYLKFDAPPGPGQVLDTLLHSLEAKVTELATQINTIDTASITAPIAQGVGAVTAILTQFANVIETVTADIRSALNGVKNVIASLHFEDIANAVKTALAPITAALDTIQKLVDTIKADLETAAKAAVAAIQTIEGTVDQFEKDLTALFDQAAQFIDSLHLDQVIGQISSKVNDFVALLAKAQMKPYFDAASSAMGDVAGTISKLPLSLLPDSMKQDLDTAVAPIRALDGPTVEAEIEDLLGISGGQFQLRPDLQAAIADIQAKFDELIATLQQHDPRTYLQNLDQQLSQIAAQISALSPQIGLQPIQDAIQKVKTEIGSFDLSAALQPVHAVFQQIDATLQEYSPDKLIDPIEKRVNDARTAIVATIRLDQWLPAIDDLQTRAESILALIDPTQIEPLVAQVLNEVQTLVDALPPIQPAGWIGTLISSLLAKANLRIYPSSFDTVTRWIQGQPAAADLTAATRRIAAALASTHAAVDGLDITALSVDATQRVASLRTAVQTLASALPADSPDAAALQAAIARLDVEAALGAISTNRTRYLTTLAADDSLGQALAATGFSDVDQAVTGLRKALSPFDSLLAPLRALLTSLGITGLDQGLSGVVRSTLAVAPPARLVGLLVPIVSAVRGRIEALIKAVLDPIRAAITELQHLISLIDLAPLKQAVDSVFNEIVAQVNAFDPDQILKDPIQAVTSLQQDLLSFDPLKDIVTVLNELRDAAARVVGKLSAEKILAAPLDVYDKILAGFQQLNLEKLLTPVLDQLDAIVKQVDDGLDETVTALQHLQAALPAGSGS